MRWKIFQFTIFASFLFANVYFDWGIEGIATAVMAGMLAWYLSYMVARILWRLGYVKEKPVPISLLYRPPGTPSR